MSFYQGQLKLYFYRYDIKNNNLNGISKEGIATSKHVHNDSIIIKNYIYTNAYKVNGDDTEAAVYRVNIINGQVDKLFSIERDLGTIILIDRYVLLRGNNFVHCYLIYALKI